MESLATCVRCGGPVTVPTDANVIWVRCPHCGEDYPADQLVLVEAPEIEVVPPPALVLGDSEQQRSSLHSSSDHGLSVPAPTVTTLVEEKIVQIRSPEPSRTPRRRRQKKDPNSFIKVALGGIMGLVIGQLILWWLPQPYRTDPMQLAPKVPTALAFLVPAELRGEIRPMERFPEGEPTKTAPNSLPTNAEEARIASLHDPQPTGVEPGSSQAANEVVLGLADQPLFSIEELRENLEATRQMDAELDGRIASKQSLLRWYLKLAEFAHSVTFADTSSPEVTEFAAQLREFLTEIASDPAKLDRIGKSSGAAIKGRAFHQKGIVLTGNVQRIGIAGHLFQTEVRLSGGSDRMVAVVSRRDPREAKTYQEGDDVVIMGVVVPDPKLYLLGYSGSEDTVVLGGLPLKISLPKP